LHEDIVEATVAILKAAETVLPALVVELIDRASRKERNPIAKYHLDAILKNIEIAKAEGLPICQDTGIPIFYLEIDRNLDINFDIHKAVSEGVMIATKEVPMRPNVVDPLSRINTSNNTGRGIPHIITEFMERDGLRITAFPKGAGSENASAGCMLNPADDPLDYVIDLVAGRGKMACPPLFVGVGIGGSFDLAPHLAKKALLKMPGSSKMEIDLLMRLNRLGVGPMGLGGDTTALGVKIETAFCHTASLPVAVNFQCWANRQASAVILEDGWSID